MKKTKIICTMGPNTNDRNLIKDLALAGMDIARFNFSIFLSPEFVLNQFFVRQQKLLRRLYRRQIR